MRKQFYFFILICLLYCFSFNVCKADEFIDNINIVKSSTFEFDKSVSIGDAFDTYEYFKETSWECFNTKQRRTVVEFKGKIDLIKIMEYILNNTNLYDRDDGSNPNGNWFWTRYKKRAEICVENDRNCILKDVDYSMIVQFLINRDSTLKLSYIGFEKDNKKYDGDFRDINYIYKGSCDIGTAIGVAAETIFNNKDVISCEEHFYPAITEIAYLEKIQNISNKYIATFIRYDIDGNLDSNDTFICYINTESIDLDQIKQYVKKKVQISFQRYQYQDINNKQCTEDWILDYITEYIDD